MQPVGAVCPELNPLRPHRIAMPVPWSRNLPRVLGRKARHRFLQDPREREWKYRSDSASSSAVTAPDTRTCRRRLFQWKHSAARGFRASSAPFPLCSLVKNQKPPASARLTRTMRTLGAPSGVAVASAAAVGSFGSPRSASAIHGLQSSNGSCGGVSSRLLMLSSDAATHRCPRQGAAGTGTVAL